MGYEIISVAARTARDPIPRGREGQTGYARRGVAGSFSPRREQRIDRARTSEHGLRRPSAARVVRKRMASGVKEFAMIRKVGLILIGVVLACFGLEAVL